LLWLWHRTASVAPTGPLAWESPYAATAALKRQKDQKKKKKITFRGKCIFFFLKNVWQWITQWLQVSLVPLSCTGIGVSSIIHHCFCTIIQYKRGKDILILLCTLFWSHRFLYGTQGFWIIFVLIMTRLLKPKNIFKKGNSYISNGTLFFVIVCGHHRKVSLSV